MAIHHDKIAYGKLASNMEELSESRIEEMLKELDQTIKENKEEDDSSAQTKE